MANKLVARAVHELPDLLPTALSVPTEGRLLAITAEVWDTRRYPRQMRLDVAELPPRRIAFPAIADRAPLEITHEPFDTSVTCAVDASNPHHSLAHSRAGTAVGRLLWSFGVPFTQEHQVTDGKQVTSYTLTPPKRQSRSRSGSPPELEVRKGLHVFGDPLSLAVEGLAVAFIALNQAGAGSVVEYQVRTGNLRRFDQT